MILGDVLRRGCGRPSVRDRRGTTTVEFAVLAPTLVALLFCIIEFAWQLTIDSALDIGCVIGARFGSTGSGTGTARDAAIVSAVIAASGGLIKSAQLTLTDQSFATAAAYASGAAPTTGAGTTAQFVVYTLTYRQAFFTALPAKLLGVSSITHQTTVAVQNEPF